MSLRSAFLVAMPLCLVLSSATHAAVTGIYVQGSGGYSMPDGDVEFSDLVGENSGRISDVDLSLKAGGMAAVAVGYDWGQFRAEGEVSYRQNDIDGATVAGPIPEAGAIPLSADGDFSALSLMANAIYEMPVGEVVSFYVGAGVGIAAVRVESDYGNTDLDIGAGAVAYQGLAGVELNISDHVAVNVGYRIWSCFDTSFDDNWNNDNDNRDNNDEDLAGDLSIPIFHAVEVGLRYTF